MRSCTSPANTHPAQFIRPSILEEASQAPFVTVPPERPQALIVLARCAMCMAYPLDALVVGPPVKEGGEGGLCGGAHPELEGQGGTEGLSLGPLGTQLLLLGAHVGAGGRLGKGKRRGGYWRKG